MASRKLEDLIPEMEIKAKEVEFRCADAGVDILIYCTLRTLEEQAILYRQSRPFSLIVEKVRKLRERGFGFLADVLLKVGAQSGPYATDAGPGESWHNYAEAIDGVPMIGGKIAWSYDDAPKSWDIYANACREAGLNYSGDWVKFKELCHAQLRHGSNPLKLYKPDEIKAMLVKNKLLEV